MERHEQEARVVLVQRAGVRLGAPRSLHKTVRRRQGTRPGPRRRDESWSMGNGEVEMVMDVAAFLEATQDSK